MKTFDQMTVEENQQLGATRFLNQLLHELNPILGDYDLHTIRLVGMRLLAGSVRVTTNPQTYEDIKRQNRAAALDVPVDAMERN